MGTALPAQDFQSAVCKTKYTAEGGNGDNHNKAFGTLHFHIYWHSAMEETRKEVSKCSPCRNSTSTPTGLKTKMSQCLWIWGERIKIKDSCHQITIEANPCKLGIQMPPSPHTLPCPPTPWPALCIACVTFCVLSGDHWVFLALLTAARWQGLPHLSLDAPQHLAQVRSTPWSSSAPSTCPLHPWRSGPRLRGMLQTASLPGLQLQVKWLCFGRKCFWCRHLRVKRLWGQNYRI